jgi:hypothetical protein
MKVILSTILLISVLNFSFGQTTESKSAFTETVNWDKKTEQEIYDALKHNDHLLFSRGFNQCDTNQVRILTSEDFEFYHDQGGITNSVDAFIQSIAGLCNMLYKPTRELEPESMEIHLLRQNEKIYGAIQNGKHQFFGEENNKPKYLTSTAAFTHLWILENGDWKLKRVLSYNHQVPN